MLFEYKWIMDIRIFRRGREAREGGRAGGRKGSWERGREPQKNSTSVSPIIHPQALLIR